MLKQMVYVDWPPAKNPRKATETTSVTSHATVAMADHEKPAPTSLPYHVPYHHIVDFVMSSVLSKRVLLFASLQIIHESIYDEVVSRLVKAYAQVPIGDPLEGKCTQRNQQLILIYQWAISNLQVKQIDSPLSDHYT